LPTGEDERESRRYRVAGAGAGRVLYTIVIEQIAYWIRTKEGRARARLQTWLRQSIEALEGRILSFNVGTAHVWADQKL